MKIFLKHAREKHNLSRAVKMSIIVGTILGCINHIDMFISGEYELKRILQIIITYFVPFSVSLYSSAMSGRHHELLKKKAPSR